MAGAASSRLARLPLPLVVAFCSNSEFAFFYSHFAYSMGLQHRASHMPRVTVTVPGGFPQPYSFQLDHPPVVFGRLEDCDIQIDSASISSRHAQMTRVQGGFELRDLDSTNGVKVNGQRVAVVVLREGSSIELGDVTFNFELAPEERAVLDMEASVALGAETLEKQLLSQQATSPRMPPASTPLPAPSNSSQRPVVPPAPVTVVAAKGGNGGGGFLLLLLALVGFCVGMALRYHEDTGRSWIDAVRDKFTASQGPASPAR